MDKNVSEAESEQKHCDGKGEIGGRVEDIHAKVED